MEEINEATALGPIVATADAGQEDNAAHAALEAALGRLEGRVKELEAAVHKLQPMHAQAEVPASAGRKTATAAHVSLLAKGTAEPGAPSVDDALRSLSIEQRIAVKSGLMRAGWVG